MTYTTEQIIEQYITLRDRKEALTATLKTDLEPIVAAMDTIEGYLLDLMNKSGESSKATPAGTAFIKTSEFVGVSDFAEFSTFAASQEDGMRFFNKDANKTAVQEYIKEHGVPPPGIKYTTAREVQIRRPKS